MDTAITADPIAATGKTKQAAVVPTLNIIKYNGIVDAELAKGMRTFSPMTSIHELSARYIHVKDSLEQIRGTLELTDPADSAVFVPLEDEAYQAIMTYKKMMAMGPQLGKGGRSLLDLVRVTDQGDESVSMLPEITEAGVLSHGKFFFLGGAPFITKMMPEDNAVFKDSKGNPETRFENSITENGEYILNAIYYFRNIRTFISYGPPLSSYDYGPQDVRGIGSINHELMDRLPIVFLTKNGLIAGQLSSIAVKIVPEYRGCVSDQPQLVFSCAEQLEANDIIGVYIPLTTDTLSSCVITRESSALWTADLNSDGVPDLACVSGTFEGISSDTMAEVLWFVNINGAWKIIDHGADLDCT